MDQHLPEPRCPEGGDPADRLSYVFRGVSMGQLICKAPGDRIQVVWRTRDKIIIHYFLAKHSYQPHTVKTSHLRGLALLLDIDVKALDHAEWAAIENKMRSSLAYHLSVLMKTGFKSRFDAEEGRQVYTWPEELRNTLLQSVCEGCQGGGCDRLHIHVRGNDGGNDVGDDTPPPPIPTRPPQTPPQTPRLNEPEQDVGLRPRPTLPAELGGRGIEDDLSPHRWWHQQQQQQQQQHHLGYLGPILDNIAKQKKSLSNVSIAHMDACGELIDAALNVKDLEARLPLYVTILCGLLPAGGVPAPVASSDVVFLRLLWEEDEARGVAGRQAVGQLLTRVELLGKEREEAERRARVAVEEARGPLSRVACYLGLADPSWLLALCLE